MKANIICKIHTGFLLIFLSLTQVYSGWYPLTSGTSETLNSVYFPQAGNGNIGYVVGAAGTILITTNAGLNWSAQTSPSGNDLGSVTFTSLLSGWACGSNGTIIHTTNGGINWVLQNNPATTILYSVSFLDQNTGWAVGYTGTIVFTSNGGSNWVLQTSPSSYYLRAVFCSSASNVIAAGQGSTIIKTTNLGTNWFSVQTGGGGPTLYGLFFLNPNTGWAAGYSSLITTNGGYNWSQRFYTGIYFSVYFINADTGWTVGDGGALSYTTNTGTNWYSQSSGTANWLYSIYFTSSGTGYIAGDVGTILKTTDGGGLFTGVSQISSNVPKEFRLYQNYPNPFNPSTKIQFDVRTPLNPPFVQRGESEAGGFVKLIIYDILGREVAALVNQKLLAGTYEYQWNAANLSSGVYFYKLTAGNFTDVKKMVLLK